MTFTDSEVSRVRTMLADRYTPAQILTEMHRIINQHKEARRGH